MQERKRQSWDLRQVRPPEPVQLTVVGLDSTGSWRAAPGLSSLFWSEGIGVGVPFLSLYYEIVGIVAWSPQCPVAGSFLPGP